jgi:class 3 adenylate cyclase/tetratricopeptide (TPR) repeat protein
MKFCGQCTAPLALVCPKCRFENPPGFKFCGQCTAPLNVPEGSGRSPTVTASTPTIRVVAEQAEASSLEGERKTVTALFADIKGSTELMEELDPEEARAIIDPALRLMIDAAHRYDGYVVQSTGDGIFALFGAPVAHEDHPQRALYAALRMQEELRRYSAKVVADGSSPIQGRVGINTGEVVVRSIQTGAGQTEYTPIGHTTNLASRMQTAAPVGSIAVSENTRRLCEGYFILKPLGATKVKGVSEPVNVYEVTGLGPLRTRLQRSAGRGLTKFVGREREMDTMRSAADRAISGHGQIVAAMAEPGVGKSRLYFEFRAKNQSGWMVLETFSVSHGKASAYLPVLDLLHGYFKIAGQDDERTRREKVAGKITILERSLEDTLPYLFSLLGIVEGEDPLAQMDGQLKKRRTLEAIKRIILRESLNQPLMVIFEDLHWIDEATQEFLNLLADSLGTAKILLLVNYRPEYSHQWNSKTYYTQLRLDPLGQESADEMLSALLGDGKDLIPLKRLIIERTEGNPFFMEETVQVLLDEGALVHDGAAVRLTKSLNTLKIPPTVHGILAARIDRLPAEAKDLLQTLAVIGREFPLSLIRAVLTKSDDELSALLNDLQLREFIYEQPAVGDAEYIFKHALTQEVAYNSVLIERRKQLHKRIGAALETLYASSLEDHLAELANHYGRANNPDKAVQYLTLAGKQALERSAFAQSQGQLQQGLEWIEALPESVERDAREMELASALAQGFLITRGFTAPETREAAERARVLAEKGGNLAQLVRRIFGIWLGTLVSGDYLTAGVLADRILYLAQRDGNPAGLAFAHHAEQSVHYLRGDLVGAQEHFAHLEGFLEAPDYRQTPGTVAVAMGNASRSAWTLGYADQARARIAQMIAFDRESKSPFGSVFARFLESWLYRLMREPQRTEAAATLALAICEEHGFPFLRGQVGILMGWARAQLGSPREGISMIRQGLADLAESGSRLGLTDQLTRLAEAQALDGKIDDALVTIEEALKANPEELVFRPNILTCRGELQIKVGQPQLAETDFREAITLAQRMSAKAFELRATTSLARLLSDTGRRDEARAMLADIYGWFTEGFDTADLKDAKALLDELGK